MTLELKGNKSLRKGSWLLRFKLSVRNRSYDSDSGSWDRRRYPARGSNCNHRHCHTKPSLCQIRDSIVGSEVGRQHWSELSHIKKEWIHLNRSGYHYSWKQSDLRIIRQDVVRDVEYLVDLHVDSSTILFSSAQSKNGAIYGVTCIASHILTLKWWNNDFWHFESCLLCWWTDDYGRYISILPWADPRTIFILWSCRKPYL